MKSRAKKSKFVIDAICKPSSRGKFIYNFAEVFTNHLVYDASTSVPDQVNTMFSEDEVRSRSLIAPDIRELVIF